MEFSSEKVTFKTECLVYEGQLPCIIAPNLEPWLIFELSKEKYHRKFDNLNEDINGFDEEVVINMSQLLPKNMKNIDIIQDKYSQKGKENAKERDEYVHSTMQVAIHIDTTKEMYDPSLNFKLDDISHHPSVFKYIVQIPLRYINDELCRHFEKNEDVKIEEHQPSDKLVKDGDKKDNGSVPMLIENKDEKFQLKDLKSSQFIVHQDNELIIEENQ